MPTKHVIVQNKFCLKARVIKFYWQSTVAFAGYFPPNSRVQLLSTHAIFPSILFVYQLLSIQTQYFPPSCLCADCCLQTKHFPPSSLCANCCLQTQHFPPSSLCANCCLQTQHLPPSSLCANCCLQTQHFPPSSLCANCCLQTQGPNFVRASLHCLQTPVISVKPGTTVEK